MAVYQIRQGGKVLCESSVKNLGYSPATLRNMAKAGLFLYKDGKKVKLCELE